MSKVSRPSHPPRRQPHPTPLPFPTQPPPTAHHHQGQIVNSVRIMKSMSTPPLLFSFLHGTRHVHHLDGITRMIPSEPASGTKPLPHSKSLPQTLSSKVFTPPPPKKNKPPVKANAAKVLRDPDLAKEEVEVSRIVQVKRDAARFQVEHQGMKPRGPTSIAFCAEPINILQHVAERPVTFSQEWHRDFIGAPLAGLAATQSRALVYIFPKHTAI